MDLICMLAEAWFLVACSYGEVKHQDEQTFSHKILTFSLWTCVSGCLHTCICVLNVNMDTCGFLFSHCRLIPQNTLCLQQDVCPLAACLLLCSVKEAFQKSNWAQSIVNRTTISLSKDERHTRERGTKIFRCRQNKPNQWVLGFSRGAQTAFRTQCCMFNIMS